MCGIIGVATGRSERPRISIQQLEHARDLLAHRGPDGAGLIDLGHTALAHRRLAVLDLSDAGAQPMTAPLSAPGVGGHLVYNGELYNDIELRRELTALGWPFRTGSDAETVLAALSIWGVEALPRLRGMFALAWVDALAETLVIARDELGIKPLWYWMGESPREIAFASEPAALIAHPRISARPDLVGLSAYLTTIRTTIGERSMFSGVRALSPGTALVADLRDESLGVRRVHFGRPGSPVSAPAEVVRDSVLRHLRSDAPICCMLSGGLDSSIIGACAIEHVPDLATYCAGAAPAPSDDQDDPAFARLMAAQLHATSPKATHTELRIDRDLFFRAWHDMVLRMGMPLSTPNEVAINRLARLMRDSGRVVTLSGEGADELFAGYDQSLRAARLLEQTLVGVDDSETLATARAMHVLEAEAWVPVSAKGALLADPAWRALEGDIEVMSMARDAMLRAAEDAARSPDEGLDACVRVHLAYQQRGNLVALLQRLDSAMMLESIEGRTPFADREVAAVAGEMAMRDLVDLDAVPARTKLPLRSAFERAVPDRVVSRPKASFPLPFAQWIDGASDMLRGSAFLRSSCRPEIVEAVAIEPTRHWRVAWPLANVALWAKRWGW